MVPRAWQNIRDMFRPASDRSRVVMGISMASASAGRSSRNVERRPQEDDRPVTPILFRPSGQPVSTNMHLCGRSRLDVRLECFHAAGSADSAVLITDLRTQSSSSSCPRSCTHGQELSLMTPSLPSQ